MRMRSTIVAGALALAASTAPAEAPVDQMPRCGQWSTMRAMLAERWGEREIVALLLDGGRTAIVVTASETTGSWTTLVRSARGGLACVSQIGTGVSITPPPPAGKTL